MKIEETKNYFFLILIDLVCVNLNNTYKFTVVIPHAGCSHCLARLCSRIYQYYSQWCKSLLSIGGDNLQFYPNFALFLTLKGINLDHDFFQVSKLSEDQTMEHFFSPNSDEDRKKKKKKVFTKNGTLFSPNTGKDLRSGAHQSQIIGGGGC